MSEELTALAARIERAFQRNVNCVITPVEARGYITVLRSSLSTSDAGGGVRALEYARRALVALRTRLKTEPAVQGRAWVDLGILLNNAVDKVEAALSNPAAADSNASAAVLDEQARLIELAEEMDKAAALEVIRNGGRRLPVGSCKIIAEALRFKSASLVGANASAEARLREALDKIKLMTDWPCQKPHSLLSKIWHQANNALSGETAPAQTMPDVDPEYIRIAQSERDALLPGLWAAIVHHANCDSGFWLGEALLNEITSETGYCGPEALSPDPHASDCEATGGA